MKMEERIVRIAADRLGLKPERGGYWVAVSIAKEYADRTVASTPKAAARWFRREVARLGRRRFIGA
jgi:hypothetical protein